MDTQDSSPQARVPTTRSFLSDTSMSFTGLVLGAILSRDRMVRAENPGSERRIPSAHFAPKDKHVIWRSMVGSASQIETFDPKLDLNQHARMLGAESP